MNQLLLKNVCKRYPNQPNYALDHINLTVRKGEFVAVMGRSGSGDSDIMMTDTINSFKSKFKGFHKTFKQDDLGLSLSSFLLN